MLRVSRKLAGIWIVATLFGLGLVAMRMPGAVAAGEGLNDHRPAKANVPVLQGWSDGANRFVADMIELAQVRSSDDETLRRAEELSREGASAADEIFRSGRLEEEGETAPPGWTQWLIDNALSWVVDSAEVYREQIVPRIGTGPQTAPIFSEENQRLQAQPESVDANPFDTALADIRSWIFGSLDVYREQIVPRLAAGAAGFDRGSEDFQVASSDDVAARREQEEREAAEAERQRREELARREQEEREAAEAERQRQEELARREQEEREAAEAERQRQEELARREQEQREAAEAERQRQEELARREQEEREAAEAEWQRQEELARREQEEREAAEAERRERERVAALERERQAQAATAADRERWRDLVRRAEAAHARAQSALDVADQRLSRAEEMRSTGVQRLEDQTSAVEQLQTRLQTVAAPEAQTILMREIERLAERARQLTNAGQQAASAATEWQSLRSRIAEAAREAAAAAEEGRRAAELLRQTSLRSDREALEVVLLREVEKTERAAVRASNLLSGGPAQVSIPEISRSDQVLTRVARLEEGWQAQNRSRGTVPLPDRTERGPLTARESGEQRQQVTGAQSGPATVPRRTVAARSEPDGRPIDLPSRRPEPEPRVARVREPDDAPARPRVYIVKDGDTLWDIAEEYLGAGWRYCRIFRANRRVVRSPHRIYPNQRLVLPAQPARG